MELTKTVLVSLTLREGEREFDLKPFTSTVKAGLSNDDIAKEVITEFYGESKEVDERGRYFYDNGEYCIYLTEVKYIPKKEFEILSKYL